MTKKDPFELPAIIGVGPVRSGTTWLHEVLRAHPGIQVPHHVKELNFFSLKYDRGVQWYKSQFMPLDNGAKMWGEVSPSYIAHPSCPQRIKELVPHAKIVISLRNIYEMTVSMYGLHIRYGGRDMGLHEAIVSNALRKISFGLDVDRLSTHIRSYLDVFGRNNVFFMIYDNLVDDPVELARDIYEFAGVENEHIDPAMEERHNKMLLPNNRLISKTAASIQSALRRFDLHNIANVLKNSAVIRKIVYNDKGSLNISTSEKEKAFLHLRDTFNSEIERLSELAGVSLDHWKYNP